jgi:type III HopA1-like effector protein
MPYLAQLLTAAASAPPGNQDDLATWIYHHGYIIRYPQSKPDLSKNRKHIGGELARANRGRAFMDMGWVVETVPGDGSVVATKHTARRRFSPGEFLTQRNPGGKPEAGDPILVHAPVEGKANPSDPFCFAFGETVSPFGQSEELIRFYWNISADGAPQLVSLITGELNRFQIPFRFKCPWRESEYYRLDCAVLYVHKFYWPIVAKLARRIHRQVAESLCSGSLPLTRALAPGLSLAEDPGEGRSFGMHRCTLLARAAFELRLNPDADPLDIAARHFRDAGLDLRIPYLNPGSEDIYDAF